MIKSIPKTAIDLGIGFEDYEKLALNIGRMNLLTASQRQKILDKADKELPKKIYKKADPLITDLADDKQAYNIAGLKYDKGPPKGQQLFTTAVADFLLRNKQLFEKD